jgi:hypothetical protein
VGAFDYLFTFYGLLLDIAVANVAIGFADMWRDHQRIEVGSCPPLLATIVLLGCMNVWLTLWHIHMDATLSGVQMLVAAAIALPYVFVSRAMFPGVVNRPESSLEAHYLKNRVLILGMLAVPAIASAAAKLFLDRVSDHGWELAWIGVRIAMPLLLLPLASRVAQRWGLMTFIAVEVVGLFR